MADNLSTRAKFFWIAVLYFAEGFPYALVHNVFSVYFRSHGISLTEIGLMSLATLPWSLKFLWAPAVDIWGLRRHWFAFCQMCLAVTLGIFFWLSPTSMNSRVWILLVMVAVFSATQDIAIDAYSIGLANQDEMGPVNGVRVSAYRVALFCAGGGLIWLAGRVSWSAAFATASVLLAACALLSMRAPEARREQPAEESWSQVLNRTVVGALQTFWRKPGVVHVIAFIILFKLGDVALGPMVRPFWVDQKFTLEQIGAVLTPVGLVSTVAGALLGGRLTKQWGLFRALWILGIAQAASNLAYAGAAMMPAAPFLLYTASFVESFCGGLGTAPFLAFLMSICDKQQAAMQYAVLSALFSLTGPLFGSFSGHLTESFGYVTYFTATFFLAWPAFLLLPWVKLWIREEQPDS